MHDNKENEVTENEREKKKGSIDSDALSLDARLMVEDGGVECSHCGEGPCVWVTKKEDMRLFDVSEHGHLPDDDSPPNNIRRKSIYRSAKIVGESDMQNC
jgi:hypothetical protein